MIVKTAFAGFGDDPLGYRAHRFGFGFCGDYAFGCYERCHQVGHHQALMGRALAETLAFSRFACMVVLLARCYFLGFFGGLACWLIGRLRLAVCFAVLAGLNAGRGCADHRIVRLSTSESSWAASTS